MFRLLPILTAFGLIVAAGVVDGIHSHRWTPNTALADGAAKIADFPLSIGDWDGQAIPIDPRQLAMIEASGYAHRRFKNRRNGNEVTMMLLCGPSGTMAVHTPEVCFGGAGFNALGSPTRFTPTSDPSSRFWMQRFQKQGPVPIKTRVYYAWSTDGNWKAPDNPRFEFANAPALFKLYILREESRDSDQLENEVASDFLRVLLPKIRSMISPDQKD